MAISSTDIAIIGAGLTGKLAALAIATQLPKLSVLLIGPEFTGKDDRAFFLSPSSVNLLRALDLMNGLQHQTVTRMDVRDGTSGQNSRDAFPLIFGTEDIRSDDGIELPLGILVESIALSVIIDKVLVKSKIRYLRQAVERVSNDANGFTYHFQDGGLGIAALGIVADGRHSTSRKQLGIETTQLDYKQIGIVSVLSHSKDHEGVAFQAFLPGGPFATLPLPKEKRVHRSALVWTLPRRAAKAALALPSEMLMKEISQHIPPELGAVKSITPAQRFPLILQIAKRYAVPHAALIGDSAHVIHPLAGQGLNLGIRDIAALVDVIADAQGKGMEFGGAPMMGEYERWRRFDGAQLAAATDSLSRLYKTKLSFLGHARRTGMSLVNHLPPVKSMIMAEASGTSGETPSLLR